MEHLIFCLNATVPIFLMMAVGFFFRRIGLVDKVFADKMNAFVFKAALPALVFKDLAGADFFAVWDGPFVLFCLFTTGVSILSVLLVSRLFSAEIRGEFVQASYRSSVALLGVAFIETIYGTAGAAPLMIIGAVPLYNIAAVLVLTLMRPGRGRLERALLKKTFWDVASNPILIGILVGILWSLLRIPQPVILSKNALQLCGGRYPYGPHWFGRIGGRGQGQGGTAPGHGLLLFQAHRFRGPLSSRGGPSGVPYRQAGDRAYHAWLRYHLQQLCYGPESGL